MQQIEEGLGVCLWHCRDWQYFHFVSWVSLLAFVAAPEPHGAFTASLYEKKHHHHPCRLPRASLAAKTSEQNEQRILKIKFNKFTIFERNPNPTYPLTTPPSPSLSLSSTKLTRFLGSIFNSHQEISFNIDKQYFSITIFVSNQFTSPQVFIFYQAHESIILYIFDW